MDSEDLRLAVYREFAATGRAPEAGSLAARLGTGISEVADGLAELARARHLAAAGLPRGYVMDLGTLRRLAAAYLRGVGLPGSFWGL